MADNTAKQIEELNLKVDTILEYVNQQRLKSQAVDDLVADVSIIGKDAYDSTVKPWMSTRLCWIRISSESWASG